MKERLDKVLTARGLAATRSQAKSLIEKGDVQVNGVVVERAGELVDPAAVIDVNSPLFVGRGAFKLIHALETFKVPVKDLVFIDVGASTGGFTEVLLQEGARRVYAVDVGHDQLASKLRDDPRVINLERTNIRELQSLPEICDGAVMDLSFISITKVLGRVLELLAPEAFLIALVKPQFEAGADRMPKDGVLKDARLREKILSEVLQEAQTLGWSHLSTVTSPIQGKAGNVEYLCLLQRRP
jgi:23S rRNA (cytidine1920-2'-O)/16S rRNA (cytidine1409-2'-O)-methyltransferase